MRDGRVGALLQTAGLPSGGQAQRVRFAMAIAGNPELLFLDEPTVGMDVETRRAFRESMRDFAAEGRTVVFATHYLDEADAVADCIVVLSRGQVVADGSATEIKAMATNRCVRFTLPAADLDALRGIAAVTSVIAHGDTVEIRTTDSDATVRALVTRDVPFHDLEVMGGGLEDAFIALTQGASSGD